MGEKWHLKVQGQRSYPEQYTIAQQPIRFARSWTLPPDFDPPPTQQKQHHLQRNLETFSALSGLEWFTDFKPLFLLRIDKTPHPEHVHATRPIAFSASDAVPHRQERDVQARYRRRTGETWAAVDFRWVSSREARWVWEAAHMEPAKRFCFWLLWSSRIKSNLGDLCFAPSFRAFQVTPKRFGWDLHPLVLEASDPNQEGS